MADNSRSKLGPLWASGNLLRALQGQWKAGVEKLEHDRVLRRQQRLPETMREHRAKLESVTAVAVGKMTVGNASQVYLEKIRFSVSLKPRSKNHREMMMDFISRSWPALLEMDVRKVSERDCQDWLARFQRQYAPSVVNNGIETLRAVFEGAVGNGARFSNPAAKLSRMRVRPKRLELPSRDEFLRFVEEIRTAGAGQSRDCANLVRFLAYSGVRIGEARYVIGPIWTLLAVRCTYGVIR